MYFNMGPVEIELYGNESPLNVANFLNYVDSGAYDDSFIHRTRASNPSQPLGFDLFAQGGSFKYPINSFIDSNPIIPGPQVVNEFNASNGLTNKPGSLAAARASNPNSASSGWFINQSNNSASFDPGPYTVLGQVTSGMNVIDQIPFLPNAPGLSGTSFASTPFYQGDLVVIERVARIPILAGDYDFNKMVNQADYTVWRNNFGSATNAAADGNGDGRVNAADYTIWRDHLGQSLMPGSGSGGLGASGVPEPSAMMLVVIAAGVLAAASWYRRVNH
jgi:cyclophilin family peptidyl-prolyl cis-trans isomerase